MRLFLCCLLLGIGSLFAQAPNIEPMASTGYGNTVYVWGVRINTQEAGELATQLWATQAAQRLAKGAPSRMVAPAVGLGSGLSLEEAANHLQEASDLEKRYNYFQNSPLGTLMEMRRMMQHRRLIDAANFAIDEYNRSLNPSVSP